MKDVHKLIETVVTTKALAAYLTAESGESFGIYPDCTFAVGESIGNEIEPKERPIACIKCPGINNIDTTYFTDDFVTYNHISGMYESIEQDRTGLIETYTLAGVIRECCENGDVDVELEELKNALIEGWCQDLIAAQDDIAAMVRIQGLRDWSAYFDDLEGHIEMLETESGVIPDSEHRDALKERIVYLKTLTDTWIDNDTTASPDAWKTLATFSDVAALEQYRKWTDDA